MDKQQCQSVQNAWARFGTAAIECLGAASSRCRANLDGVEGLQSLYAASGVKSDAPRGVTTIRAGWIAGRLGATPAACQRDLSLVLRSRARASRPRALATRSGNAHPLTGLPWSAAQR